MNPNYQAIKVLNRDKFEKYSKEYEKISNSIYNDITKVLITLNTALLAFTSPLVGGKIVSESCPLKTLLILVWSFLGLSIVSGIIQLYIEHSFFDKTSKFYDGLTNLFNEAEASEKGINKARREMITRVREQYIYETASLAFGFQIFFFLSSLLLLIIIFALVL